MDSWKEIDERNKFKKKKINDVKLGLKIEKVVIGGILGER